MGKLTFERLVASVGLTGYITGDKVTYQSLEISKDPEAIDEDNPDGIVLKFTDDDGTCYRWALEDVIQPTPPVTYISGASSKDREMGEQIADFIGRESLSRDFTTVVAAWMSRVLDRLDTIEQRIASPEEINL